jgi:hypothetical protein
LDPKIIFTVPPHVAGIAREVEQFSGAVDGIQPAAAVEAMTLLHAREGRVVEVVFPEPVDPMDWPTYSVKVVAKELAAATMGYAYLVAAWTEPSRGVAVKGRVVVSDGLLERWLEIPWEHGAPAPDMQTLLAGDPSTSKAEAVQARFRMSP